MNLEECKAKYKYIARRKLELVGCRARRKIEMIKIIKVKAILTRNQTRMAKFLHSIL